MFPAPVVSKFVAFKKASLLASRLTTARRRHGSAKSLFAVAWLAVGLALVLIPSARAELTGTVTTLHSLNSNEGQDPETALVLGNDGNLYGTALGGGAYGLGTVFRITPAGTLTVLHSFAGGSDGDAPDAFLLGSDGNFYGTTRGAGATGDYGTIFRITPDGALTTLHTFAGGADGQTPRALILGSDGNFYGTTGDHFNVAAQSGQRYGTIFRITPGGVLTTLCAFTGGSDGFTPNALVQGGDGAFYGTTFGNEAASDFGTIFKVTSGGALTTLYRFTNGVDEEHPLSILAGNDGNFYGTTEGSDGFPATHYGGTVFKVTPDGTLTTLQSFDAFLTYYPNPLLQAADGNFYSTFRQVGNNLYGTVFRITPGGVVTTLYNFTNGTDGAFPETGLTPGGNGIFYGTTGGFDADVATVFVFSLIPTITSPASATATVGQPFTYQIAATDNPTSFDAGNLPPGLSVNSATGLISGTPTQDGFFAVALSASQPGYTGSATLSLTVSAAPPPTPGQTPTPGPGQTPTPGPGQTPTPAPTPVPPTIRLVDPPDDLTVPLTVPLTLDASLTDPSGTAATVQFYQDATSIRTIPVTPGATYSATTTPPGVGFYTVSAVVTDQSGNQSTSSHRLHVIAPPAGETVGGVEFLGNLDGRSLAAGVSVPITAQALPDTSDAVESVTFYADGLPFATFDGSGNPRTASRSPHASSPTRRDASANPLFQASYRPPGEDKVVNLIAIALTKSGVARTSAPANVRVRTGEAQPLGVTLVAAKTALQRGQAASVTAQVSGGSGTIAHIEYFADTSRVDAADNPSAPYRSSFPLNKSGQTALTAVVTDSLGFTAPSPAVVVNVFDPPEVTITVAGSTSVAEGANARLIVRRSGDTSSTLTIRYKLAGAAKPGTDYKPLSGALTLPAGASQARLKLKTIHHTTPGGTRVAKVKLLPSTDNTYTLGSPASAKLKITDDD